MEEKAKVTATPTIAEKCGIKYKEVDGLFYPIFGESEPESYASLGKYGHRYLRVLMENDCFTGNKQGKRHWFEYFGRKRISGNISGKHAGGNDSR